MQSNDSAESKPELASNAAPFAKKCLYALLLAVIVYVVYDLTQQDYTSRYAFGSTAVGIWTFGITALLIGHLGLPSTRHRLKKASLLLLAYVGSFAYLSAGGAYYFSQSGQTRYSSRLSISDVSIWHPRFLYWEPFHNIQGNSTSRGSTLGYYYSPMIAVDRYWLHPTQQLMAELPRQTLNNNSMQPSCERRVFTLSINRRNRLMLNVIRLLTIHLSTNAIANCK